MRDFKKMAGVEGTVLDMFDREQFKAFHGQEPPAGWKEATPDDIKVAAGGERPQIVFLSAPCKGFSGLLSEEKSKTAKYQALNRLTLRGVWLMLEAWVNDPPELVLFENVPRLATRGRPLLDQITAMLRSYGYATAETVHDCGEVGGLAQSRKRFLLVARHTEKVQPLLYEPTKKPLRAVGDILGKMLMPGDMRSGPMHRIPSLAWKTWVRLAFVEQGSDWRSLNKLKVKHGVLSDYLLVPEAYDEALSVADVRFEASKRWHDGQAYGVRRWTDTSGTVAGQQSPGQGAYCVADVRCPGVLHNNAFRVVRYADHAQAVTGGSGSVGGCVADPRPKGEIFGKYAVTRFDEASGTVISGSTTGQGAFAVADPRSGMEADRDAYLTGGHYGVTKWSDSSGAVSAAACHDNGRWSVADPRIPAADDKVIALIRAIDGTWHRPFTTLELAALQSLVDPEQHLLDAEKAAWEMHRDSKDGNFGYMMLDGGSDSAWRERIGNAVPPDTAQAIASEMGRTLLLAHSGETFQLSCAPVWVQPLAIAISVAHI
jgi:site-specific DNA-cytosine methylase